MQNIGAANADDAFYRYKMPKLVAKIEGRGNGIKTNVVNNVDIAKALDRPPEYPLKFFGCELGAQINFDKATGTSIVNGAHDAKKLSDLLEGFIKKFVQCYSCGNPETVIKIKKEMITLKCKACGFVSDVDMRHKLTTFILKNPPEVKMSKEEKKLKKAEEDRIRDAAEAERKERKEKKKKDKEKKEKKEKKKKGEGEEGEDGSGDNDEESEAEEDDDGVVWMTDTSAEAAKQRAAEQLTAATAAMVTQGNIEAEEEAQRKKAEKEAQRKAQEEERLAQEAAEKLALEEKEKADKAAAAAAAAASDDPAVKLRAVIAGGASALAVAAEVKGLSVGGGLAGKMRVLYEALFAHLSSETKLADAIKSSSRILAPHSKDQPGQLAQLIAMEHLMAVTCPDRAKEIALALKALYDLDLADDVVIIAWGGKADAGKILGVPVEAGTALRKTSAPLVDWLKEEEDDEEDEEEEEDEDDE